MQIELHKNPNGDTRTAPKGITFEQFQEANCSHMTDVAAVMGQLCCMLSRNGERHDWTKKKYEKMFYNNFLATINVGADFVSGEWYQLHINEERHHLLSRCPEDVNLLDVIEMIVDCVCAGKTRSGEVRELEISSEILNKAFQNTVKLVDDMTVVK
ncbi:hypothetical protein B5F53_12075 [Blautia sp. An249]|uniref:DUF5662 family protein n=1 Tax=Blautia sp. An249 TaxID=1965603 RepID=UPI000B5532E3|nr:DUF5662 family protein [Blautia sp. An249]OUO77941.1 hypothetical protein B5F53_12075 [Blautia sp. An249]